ncbi:MAG: hypothetical protein M5T52_07095 [Ignavibacteriaceae bacterium]|nr:hypothetical protein [Ignavibacteriaceae bacterium]
MRSLTKHKLKVDSQQSSEILKRLKKEYPLVKIALEFETPFQLLISTILSAQCTDARVNLVTKTLFKTYRKPEDYLLVSNEELGKDIFQQVFIIKKLKA